MAKVSTPKVDKSRKENKEKAITVVAENSKFIIDSISKKPVINMKLLEPHLQERVATLTLEFQRAMTDVRVGFMKIGEILTNAEDLLKPHGLFLYFINSFPGFRQAQAYRYINGYKIARQHYTPAILDSILTSGIDMIGTKDKPYGKYQDVVKRLPPPKDNDTNKAIHWLNQVEANYRASRKKGATPVTDVETLQKDCFLYVVKKYRKVPEKKQLQFIRNLFAYVFGHLGFKQEEHINPVDPPADFIKTTGGEKETEEKDTE